MRKIIPVLVLLAALPLAAQVLSPAADGHVLRNQTFVFDQANPSVTFGGKTTYFNYFQNLYAGGEDTFTYDFDPGDGKATHYNRELRTILEFDLSSVTATPGNFTAQLKVTTDGNFWPTEDFLTLKAFDLSPAQQDGTITQADYNAQTVELDFQAVDAKNFNQTYSFNVTGAVDDDLANSRTYSGFVLLPDPRNGNEVSLVSSWEAANLGKTGRAQLVFASTQPDISVTLPASCVTIVGQVNDLQITIANVGQADLIIESVTETADPSGYYTPDTSGLNTTIPAGGSSSFLVRFAPATEGTFQARYRIASNDPDENPYDAVLTCLATPTTVPVIQVTAGECAQIPVNTSHRIPVTVANAGAAPLVIESVTEASDPFAVYAIDTSGMSITIAPGGSTLFHVVFSPKTTGTFVGTVRIASNDPQTPLYDLGLACSAVSAEDPDIEVTPTSVSCYNLIPGQAASQTITIRNMTQSAAGDLHLASILLSGDPEYSLDLAGTKLVLKKGEQTTFLLKFLAGASGSYRGSIAIASDDPDTPVVQVTLACAVTLAGIQTGAVPGAEASGSISVPAAALAAGAYGSFFVTDLKVHNPGTEAVTLRVFYLPTQMSNTTASYGDFVLPPGATMVLPNILKNLFGMEAGFGPLLLVPLAPSGSRVLAVSRIYNWQYSEEHKGYLTFGQFIPGVARSAFLAAGGTARLLGLGKGEKVRTNAGFTSGPDGCQLSFQLRTGSGASLGNPVPVTLGANSHIQFNDIFNTAQAPAQENVFGVFTVTSGTAFGYASVADNDTSDPVFVSMQ